MKVKLQWRQLAAGLFLIAETRGLSQGTFRNLDFESASIPMIPAGQLGGPVSAEAGLPGWIAYGGGLGHNTISLGGPAVIIFGPEWNGSDILQGNYSLQLETGLRGGGGMVGQVGQIPQDTKTLLFYGKSQLTSSFLTLAISFGGNLLSFIDLATRDNYHIYGADIAAYSGQTAELRFTAIPSGPSLAGAAIIDNIRFSPLSIPEPATVTIFLGGLGIVTLRRLGRKQRTQ